MGNYVLRFFYYALNELITLLQVREYNESKNKTAEPL